MLYTYSHTHTNIAFFGTPDNTLDKNVKPLKSEARDEVAASPVVQRVHRAADEEWLRWAIRTRKSEFV